MNIIIVNFKSEILNNRAGIEIVFHIRIGWKFVHGFRKYLHLRNSIDNGIIFEKKKRIELSIFRIVFTSL